MDLNSADDQNFDLSQVEAINDLLEECWFFDNLFNRSRSSRVLRHCHSDPYPSCSSNTKTPETRILASEKNLEASVKYGLIKPWMERKEGEYEDKVKKKMSKMRRQLSEKIRVQEPNGSHLSKKELMVGEKGRESSRRKRQSSSSSGNLQRTQTMPTYIGREDTDDEFEDQERNARLGFLIREALASSSRMTTTPQRHDVPKISSCPRHRPARNIQETRRANPNHRTLCKTLSFNLESEEIQRLKELEITPNNKQDSNPNLRDKKYEDSKIYQEKTKRAYLADQLVGKSRCVAARAPIPAWVPKESSRDMKAQIKFWARAVASNVRQEC